MSHDSNVVTAPKITFRIECSWKLSGCLGVMQEGDPGAPVSNGICVNCLVQARDEMARTLKALSA